MFCSRSCQFAYRGPTSIEARVSEILNELGLRYVTQYQMGQFVFDIAILSAHLLIECDGIYWHSSSEAKHRDKIKTELATLNGFRVLRLPQSIIEDEPDKCRALIVKELLGRR